MNPVDARSRFISQEVDCTLAISRHGPEPVKQPLAVVEAKYKIGRGGCEKASPQQGEKRF